MAFLLLSIDKKPMRLKGNLVLAGVAVHTGKGCVSSGNYKGLRSGVVVKVLESGGVVFPADEARRAFGVSRPLPVTLDSSAARIPDIADEAFIPVGENQRHVEGTIHKTAFPTELQGHWIPVSFEADGGETVAYGWVKQRQDGLDFQMLAPSYRNDISFVAVVPSHAPELRFSSD